MNGYVPSTLPATVLIAALAVVVLGGSSAAQAQTIPPCEMRLRVALTPDVPDPRDPGFLSSLLNNHPDYRLTLLRQDPENSSVISLDLTGPGPVAGCREVVDSMRKDGRVSSVELRRDSATPAPRVSTLPPSSTQTPSTVQPMGTAQAGPDGAWILKRSSGVSYVEQARVRYECDVWAVDQTGFDPTENDGGVPQDVVAAKRADYLRAEAACFQAHGYVVR